MALTEDGFTVHDWAQGMYQGSVHGGIYLGGKPQDGDGVSVTQIYLIPKENTHMHWHEEINIVVNKGYSLSYSEPLPDPEIYVYDEPNCEGCEPVTLRVTCTSWEVVSKTPLKAEQLSGDWIDPFQIEQGSFTYSNNYVSERLMLFSEIQDCLVH